VPKLTDSVVAGLKLDNGKTDQIWFDDDLPGFGVRLRAGGKGTWVVQYRAGGRTKRLTLGPVRVVTASKARKAAEQELARIILGGDPQAKKAEEQRKARSTLGAVAELYLEAQRDHLKPKTVYELQRYLRKLWKPLHGSPVHKIERRDVTARVAEIKRSSGASSAGHARIALSGMFAWAIAEGLTDENPVIGSNAPKERRRERVLSSGFKNGRSNPADAEIAEVWRACEDDDYGRIVRLLILTGQRRGEVAGMRWSEVDLDAAIWRLPTERTKNGRPHAVPLSPLAVEIIDAVPRRDGRDLLFGLGPYGFNGWGRPKLDMQERISEARKKISAESMKGWVVHDLRRSFATGLADLSVLPHVIEAALNHISGHKSGVAGTYNLSVYEPEVRAAMLRWEAHLRALLGDRKSTVISLRKA
jgi:integrase